MDNREKCRQEFLATKIEDNAMNWHIWKRAWTAATIECENRNNEIKVLLTDFVDIFAPQIYKEILICEKAKKVLGK